MQHNKTKNLRMVLLYSFRFKSYALLYILLTETNVKITHRKIPRIWIVIVCELQNEQVANVCNFSFLL